MNSHDNPTSSSIPSSNLLTESIQNEKQKVIIEDSLAEAMLSEIQNNKLIQEQLFAVAKILHDNIYLTIINTLVDVDYDVNSLKKHKSKHEGYQIEQAMGYLINEHSNKGRQKTGVLKNYTPKEISEDSKLLQQLLENLTKNLLFKDGLNNKTDVEKCLKALTDATFCYVEYFPHANKDYVLFKSLIMPSEQESFARIKYTEIGQGGKLTINSGIGKSEQDIIDEDKAPEHAYASGKSTYALVNSYQRLELEVSNFDRAKQTQENILSGKYIDELDDDELALFKKAKQTADNLIPLMEKFHIPLEAGDRKPLDDYIRNSFIERLSRTSTLPLIATSSGTEGRALVTLYDLNAFDKNEEFKPLRALLMTNCLFSALQHGGHHSYVELVEPYNRLLDAVCIACENKLEPVKLFSSFQIPLVESGKKENIIKFIHEDIRDNVESKMEQAIKIKLSNDNIVQSQDASIESINNEPSLINHVQALNLSAPLAQHKRGEIFKEDSRTLIDLARSNHSSSSLPKDPSTSSKLTRVDAPFESTENDSTQNSASFNSPKPF